MSERMENVRTKDLRPGDVIVSGPNGGGSIDSYAFWTIEREAAPVPPLPTAPYTVIRVTKSIDPDLIGQVLTFDGGDYWSNSGHTLGPASMNRRVQMFEVLSEPRTVTAKAVLDRVAEEIDFGELPGISVVKIRREFKVTDE